MKEPLTKKQKETLQFLITFNKRKGYMPSLEESAKHFKIAIVSVFERIRALEKKGWLKKKWNQKRWIVIL